ncbi:hypothetical protein NIES970_14720 [[Synechococcus] sp. NIES-970]|uniref:DUF2288 domain-containing protein n=1 Tax=Picosynechococcus sp. NKBG15041c TaxID=1407650 RepID=UPI00041455CD|nr:DUF2288 domain-containing protein [Picosynechococcus sp. NKBG15041c]BAW96540.1 hypothetical protein NIES970_14720 [[Synechococcus] sp. NIES-970]
MSDLGKQLQDGFGDSEWQDLAPHAARDALIVVHPSLDLLQVGEAIALDNAPLVSKWMNGGLVRKPTKEELERWNRATKTQKFPTLIVQPFVLISSDLPEI